MTCHNYTLYSCQIFYCAHVMAAELRLLFANSIYFSTERQLKSGDCPVIPKAKYDTSHCMVCGIRKRTLSVAVKTATGKPSASLSLTRRQTRSVYLTSTSNPLFANGQRNDINYAFYRYVRKRGGRQASGLGCCMRSQACVTVHAK